MINAVVRWLGNACFVVTSGATRVAIDPWITGNPGCPIGIDDFPTVDGVLVTHGHQGHYGHGDAVTIARRFNAPLYAPGAVVDYIRASVENSQAWPLSAVGPGDTFTINAFDVSVVSVPHPPVRDEFTLDGPPGEPNLGFQISVETLRLLHMGDAIASPRMLDDLTAGRFLPDVVLLPLWCQEMGWSEADAVASAALIIRRLRPKVVIPHARYRAGVQSGVKLRDAIGATDVTVLDVVPGDRCFFLS